MGPRLNLEIGRMSVSGSFYFLCLEEAVFGGTGPCLSYLIDYEQYATGTRAIPGVNNIRKVHHDQWVVGLTIKSQGRSQLWVLGQFCLSLALYDKEGVGYKRLGDFWFFIYLSYPVFSISEKF